MLTKQLDLHVAHNRPWLTQCLLAIIAVLLVAIIGELATLNGTLTEAKDILKRQEKLVDRIKDSVGLP